MALSDEERQALQGHDQVVSFKRRHLGVFALAGVIFFTATGGAYGTEATVQAAGPFWTLLAFMVLPWIWSLPQAMYTAELSTLLPTDGGISVWAKVAFGEYWGFNGGMWSWMEGCSTLAAYPTVVVDYVEQVLDNPLDPALAWLLKAVMGLIFVGLNMRGVNWVGVSAASLGVFVLSPLLVMSILGLPMVQPSAWLQSQKSFNWTYFLNLMLWNMSGYDNMGAVSGEVKNPRHTIPKAQIIAVIGGTLAFIIPLAVATGVDTNWSDWGEGHLTVVAETISGDWLVVWILIGAGCARMSNFMAELCTNSFFLQGMSEQGMLPSLLSWRHPTFDTPWVSILFNFCVVLVLMMMQLGEILQLANLFTIVSFILGVLCLFKIRRTRPVITRDAGTFSIPVRSKILVACLIPSVILMITVLWYCTYKIFILALVLFTVGQLAYLLMLFARNRKLVPFVNPPPIGEVWFSF